MVSRMTSDFLTKVNMVKYHFKFLPPDVIYHLFKTYCRPLYGSQMFDLSSDEMNNLCKLAKSYKVFITPAQRTPCK